MDAGPNAGPKSMDLPESPREGVTCDRQQRRHQVGQGPAAPVAPPDAETIMWARASLLAHADKTRDQAQFVARPEPLVCLSVRRKISGFLRSHRGATAAAAVVVMVAAGIGASVVGIPPQR
jgi:hypothetical protein